MLCEKCQKHQGTFLFRFLVPGDSEPQDILLCAECVKKAVGNGKPIGVIDGAIVSTAQVSKEEREEEIKQLMQMRCETCNATLGEVSMRRKFGCPNCYSVFGDLLATADAIIARENKEEPTKADDPETFKQQVQQSIEEREKRRKLDSLKRRMETDIKNERYEHCASLNEQIEALKAELGIQEEEGEENND